jgi:hypothetical protein
MSYSMSVMNEAGDAGIGIQAALWTWTAGCGIVSGRSGSRVVFRVLTGTAAG